MAPGWDSRDHTSGMDGSRRSRNSVSTVDRGPGILAPELNSAKSELSLGQFNLPEIRGSCSPDLPVLRWQLMVVLDQSGLAGTGFHPEPVAL